MKKIAILLLCLSPVSWILAQSTKTPLETVKEVYALLKVYSVNAKDASQQKKKINTYWLFDEISLDAIKDHWTDMNKTQQSKYMVLMKKLLEKTIYEDTGDKLQKGFAKITKQENLTSQRAVVRTKITVKKNNLNVSNDYGVIKINNDWKIRDIYIDGQNLAEDYRSQYNQIIDKYGIEGNKNALLPRIEKSIAKDSDWYNFSDEDKKTKSEDKQEENKTPSKPRPSLLQ